MCLRLDKLLTIDENLYFNRNFSKFNLCVDFVFTNRNSVKINRLNGFCLDIEADLEKFLFTENQMFRFDIFLFLNECFIFHLYFISRLYTYHIHQNHIFIKI